ncbi:MAG TPA: hypothetical protein VFG83_06540 [Kofleriaceae bacterium]|nr:hypothetical protein [Kofleriaceae bacterium]
MACGSKSAKVSKDTLAHLPKDATFVVGIRAGDILESDAWKKLVVPKTAGNEDFQKFLACAPWSKVDLVMVSGNIPAERATVIVKGLTRAQVQSCAEKIAKDDGETATIKNDGKLMSLKKSGDDDTMWIGWLSDTTLVVASGDAVDHDPAAQKALVEQRLAGKDGLDTNKAMMDLLASVKADTIFGAGDLSAFQTQVPGIKSIAGTIEVSGGLKMHLRVGFTDAKVATNNSKRAEGFVGMVKLKPEIAWIADRVKISTDDTFAVAKIDLSADDLGKLAGMADKFPLPFARRRERPVPPMGINPHQAPAPDMAPPPGQAPAQAAPATP